MRDTFQGRVWAAAVAGWWTILLAWGTLALVWFIYLGVMAIRPDWLLGLCGPDATWYQIETVTLWIIAVFKLCIWLAAFAAAWLTLWAWQLKKGAGD